MQLALKQSCGHGHTGIHAADLACRSHHVVLRQDTAGRCVSYDHRFISMLLHDLRRWVDVIVQQVGFTQRPTATLSLLGPIGSYAYRPIA
jgi:hypothetical protein